MTTVLQLATSDAYVRQDLPSSKNPEATRLTVASGGSSRYAYLYFNRPFPLGVTVLSATLRLFQQGVAAGGSRILTAQRVGAKWTESTLAWSNKPAATGATAASAAQGNGGTDGRVWEIDVTTLMQTVADGAAWYGLRVTADVSTVLYLFSSEADDFNPQLEIEWSDAPDVPSVLSPSNGRAVSIARPTLRFDFTDNSGDTTMQAYQVQINTSTDFTTPLIDTGTVASNLPEHTLTTDTPASTVRYWRVRVQDGAGLWSDWSEVQSFTRTAKPTVTIDSPAGFMSEATPPILWTVTGQTAYQVFITDPVDTATVLWTSGKVTSTDDSVTVPASAGLAPGGEYGLTVRIWDAVDRESTPGDPIYTDESTTFTFDLTSGVAPVTALVVTTADGSPDATVTWTSATAPDSYTIVLDGETYEATVDPADVLVSGTSYSYLLVGAAPRTAHTLSVLRVVNGETSDDNLEESFETAPEGLWISTLDGLHKVSLANEQGSDRSPVTFSASELSVVRKPLGATNPVLITQAVFGADGAASGTLKPVGSESLETVLATWETMTNGVLYPRGTPLSFVISNKAFRAVPYNIVASEQDEFGNWSPVQFDFFTVR